MAEPWEMTATDALAAMQALDLSPVELLESVERRADEVEPVVNALCERRPRRPTLPPRRAPGGTRAAGGSDRSRACRSR